MHPGDLSMEVQRVLRVTQWGRDSSYIIMKLPSEVFWPALFSHVRLFFFFFPILPLIILSIFFRPPAICCMRSYLPLSFHFHYLSSFSSYLFSPRFLRRRTACMPLSVRPLTRPLLWCSSAPSCTLFLNGPPRIDLTKCAALVLSRRDGHLTDFLFHRANTMGEIEER